MEKHNPILLIEDDPDEQIVIGEALKRIQVEHELKFFKDATEALQYLEKTTDKPFIILSNVHLPKVNGIELRQKIEENPNLKNKAIPFVFFTTDVREESIKEAYQFTVQGYFLKENTMEKVANSLKVMIDYWRLCKHPNSF